MTAEESWQLCGGRSAERVRGEVREMAPAGTDHGAINTNVAILLGTHVKQHDLGLVVTGEAGCRLARHPDLVRAVDVGFIRAERIPASGRPQRYFEGPPDLAVEVVSPTDAAEDVEEQVADYIEAGTRMVLVLMPRRRTVTVHRPGQQPIVLRETDTLDADEVVPGFRCPVAEFFA